MIELAATFLLLVIGITVSAPPLKNIHWKAELKRRSIDGFDSKMGLINLNTRASKVRSAPWQNKNFFTIAKGVFMEPQEKTPITDIVGDRLILTRCACPSRSRAIKQWSLCRLNLPLPTALYRPLLLCPEAFQTIFYSWSRWNLIETYF